jgi:hypothetical protein
VIVTRITQHDVTLVGLSTTPMEMWDVYNAQANHRRAVKEVDQRDREIARSLKEELEQGKEKARKELMEELARNDNRRKGEGHQQ